MAGSLEEMEKRLQKLEAIDEIKRLKAKYSQIVDGLSKEKFEECFTEDGVWDLGPAGIVKGRKAIAEMFKTVPQFQTFSVHYFVQPEIIVDGNKATGKWYMWLPATQADGVAVWSTGYEDEKYEKVNGKWLIKELKLTPIFRAPFEEGWHKKNLVGPVYK